MKRSLHYFGKLVQIFREFLGFLISCKSAISAIFLKQISYKNATEQRTLPEHKPSHQ
jgi:hypothetical protein